MLQVQPTKEAKLICLLNPPAAAGGSFRSSLNKETNALLFGIPPATAGGWFKSDLQTSNKSFSQISPAESWGMVQILPRRRVS